MENQALFHSLNIEHVRTPADRVAVLSLLPPNEANTFQKLIDTLTGKTTEEFLLELNHIAKFCQFKLKKIEKKKER